LETVVFLLCRTDFYVLLVFLYCRLYWALGGSAFDWNHTLVEGLLFHLSHLQASGNYSIRLSAVNPVGSSIEVFFSTGNLLAVAPTCPTPAAPTNLKARVFNSSTIILSWFAQVEESDLSCSVRMISHSAGTSEQWYHGVPAGQTNLSIVGLVLGEEYTFSVVRVTVGGVGALSIPVSQLLAVAPSSPRAVRASFVRYVKQDSTYSALVMWDTPLFDGGSAALTYTLLYSPGNGSTFHSTSPNAVTVLVGISTNRVVTGLSAHQPYRFRVFAANPGMCGVLMEVLPLFY
jgi:hypothetical protein